MSATLPVKAWSGISTFQLSDDELMNVMRNSVYPGAKDESIKFALSACRAALLDPLQKPYHLVPMSVKKPGTKDQYEWRDVVMPGIGLYRIIAARTGEHAGTDEPIFGPTTEVELGGKKIAIPEWCKVTVYRLVSGKKYAYTATEYWLENYATAGRDTDAPNTMWRKRKFGQLAKCAEAQALRKGFPEVGSQPTVEEMQGKPLNDDEAIEGQVVSRTIEQPALEQYSDEQFQRNFGQWAKLMADGKKTAEQIIATISSKAELSDEQKAKIADAEKLLDRVTIDQEPAKAEAAAKAKEPDHTSFAIVADKLNNAKDVEALSLAADMIRYIPSEEQRSELTKIYTAALDMLEGAQ